MTEPMRIKSFFDEPTNTVTYLIVDPATQRAAIIDPVLDYDHRSGRANVDSANRVLAEAEKVGARIEWVLETHVHADHLTAAPYLRAKTGARIGIGAKVVEVTSIFRSNFDLADVSLRGAEFDKLFADCEHFAIGALDVEALYTPGHTPACVLIKSVTPCSSATHCSCRITAARAPTFPAGAPAHSTARSAACSPCRLIRACSCATITRRRATMSSPGRRPSPSNGRETCRSMTA